MPTAGRTYIHEAVAAADADGGHAVRPPAHDFAEQIVVSLLETTQRVVVINDEQRAVRTVQRQRRQHRVERVFGLKHQARVLVRDARHQFGVVGGHSVPGHSTEHRPHERGAR